MLSFLHPVVNTFVCSSCWVNLVVNWNCEKRLCVRYLHLWKFRWYIFRLKLLSGNCKIIQKICFSKFKISSVMYLKDVGKDSFVSKLSVLQIWRLHIVLDAVWSWFSIWRKIYQWKIWKGNAFFKNVKWNHLSVANQWCVYAVRPSYSCKNTIDTCKSDCIISISLYCR